MLEKNKKADEHLLYLIYIELILISIVDIAVSILVQRRIANVEKTYHLQAKMKKHMDDIKQLTESKAPQDHINAKQKELSATMSESMKHQMRATPVLFVISLLLYFFILPNLFPVPMLTASPTNPAPNQTVTLTASAPAGTNNTVGVWLSGGKYGSGNVVSEGTATDTFAGTLPQGNYSAKAYDLNSDAYSDAIAIRSGMQANGSMQINATTKPVYNLFVYKIHYNTFQNSLFFILVTFVLSLTVQMMLGKRDKTRFEAKVKSGEIKI